MVLKTENMLSACSVGFRYINFTLVRQNWDGSLRNLQGQGFYRTLTPLGTEIICYICQDLIKVGILRSELRSRCNPFQRSQNCILEVGF